MAVLRRLFRAATDGTGRRRGRKYRSRGGDSPPDGSTPAPPLDGWSWMQAPQHCWVGLFHNDGVVDHGTIRSQTSDAHVDALLPDRPLLPLARAVAKPIPDGWRVVNDPSWIITDACEGQVDSWFVTDEMGYVIITGPLSNTYDLKALDKITINRGTVAVEVTIQ